MPFSLVANLWNNLTAPHPSITDIEERRQSRLLASLIVVLLATTVLAGILLSIQARAIATQAIYLLPGQLFSLVLYFLNRSGHYRVSSVLFVGSNVLLIYVRAVLSQDITWLLFLSMPVLFSAILLGRRPTIALFVFNLVSQVVLLAVDPLKITISILGTIIVSGILGSLILVFVTHRQALEQERQEELRASNEKLRASEKSLRQLNDELEQRVDARTHDLIIAKDEAEAARERAEKADQIKSQFLASMSHELRTPLNAILNFTEMMSLKMAGPINDQQEDLLVKSLDSAKHLLGLINDVLDVSKMQSGMMSLFIEDNINLREELEQVSTTAQSLLKDKAITFVKDIDADLPAISGDKRRIRQILLNLISNAAKFTEEGTITLSAKKRDANILFAVTDTGPGIAKDQQVMIFEPFIQTETGIKHAGGTGLGLPISKHLAEAHGGRLWVESDLGEGTAFFVEIPVKPRTQGTPGAEVKQGPEVEAAYALRPAKDGSNGRK